MRKPIVAGNWKMNKTPFESDTLVKELIPLVADAKCEIVVAPPFTNLERVTGVLGDSGILLGAQNVHWEKSGAFTGEVSTAMLKDLGVTYVILGHSERRQYFGETDETVTKRVVAVLEAGLTPIVCVGELLEERESGKTESVVETQVRGGLVNIKAEQAAGIVIAYEPVWAIGTGKVATTEQAQAVHKFIRGVVKDMFGDQVAEAVRIQYGGSMKADNAEALLSQPDIDGGLVGGAALKAADFAAICNAAR